MPANMTQSERATLDDKSDGILDKIAGTFARKGLDGASMQDLAAAAGMSVGNFYRYYPSKIALITALVNRCASDVQADFERAKTAEDPLLALRLLLEENLFEMRSEEAALWLQVDAAAVVHPEIAAVKQVMDASIRRNVLAMLTALNGGACASEAKVEEVADFLLLFCGSLFRQRAFEGAETFVPRVRRMTKRMFEWVAFELSLDERAESPLEVAS